MKTVEIIESKSNFVERETKILTLELLSKERAADANQLLVVGLRYESLSLKLVRARGGCLGRIYDEGRGRLR